jgi:hypothetical protein
MKPQDLILLALGGVLLLGVFENINGNHLPADATAAKPAAAETATPKVENPAEKVAPPAAPDEAIDAVTALSFVLAVTYSEKCEKMPDALLGPITELKRKLPAAEAAQAQKKVQKALATLGKTTFCAIAGAQLENAMRGDPPELL